MKTIRSRISNLVAFIALVGLIVLLIGFFSNAKTNSANPNTSPLATVAGQISPMATPSVPLARIGKPVLLKSVDRLGVLNNGQDKFVSIIGQGSSAQTVVLDPTTGATQTVANAALWNASVAGHWVVYQDQSAPNAEPHYSRIKVLDQDTRQEIALGNESTLQYHPSISGNIVVWDESQDGKLSSIYAYDLTKSKKFPIVVKSGSRGYPRISGQWMTYVQWPGLNPTGKEPSIELHAYFLKTNEDILIGLIPSPQDAGWGTQYALDEDKIVWNKSLGDQSELHLYDLTTRTDRKLRGPNDGVYYELSISAQSGVIALPDEVLDWRQPEPTFLSFELPAPIKSNASYYDFRVFGNHLFWRVSFDKEGSKVQVFTAPITR